MRAAFIKLHIAIFLAGFTAILGRLITLGEAALVWWRLLISVIALAIIIRAGKNRVSVNSRFAGRLLGIGALVGLHWLCFFGSVKYGNVSVALVCFSASGFFSALLEPVMNRRPWMPVELLLGLLCMAGIYIIFHFDAQYKVGIVLGVLAAALSAIFSNLNKQVVGRTNGLNITFWEMTGALLMLSAVMPAYIAFRGDAWMPVGMDWLWLLVLSLLCTVWAFFLQLQALQHISAVTLNISYNLEPVYGIILAFIFFRENQYLTPAFFAGLLLIVIAVGIQMLRVKRRTASAG